MRIDSFLSGRRDFLKLSAMCGTTLLLTHNKAAFAQKLLSGTQSQNHAQFLNANSPIDRTLGNTAEKKFFGDVNTRPHEILWDLQTYLQQKKVQGPIETVPLVIVGGRWIGMFTAYLHKKHQPVVLEQAERFGGNAKGQSWQGMDFALGSAYIDKPHPGTPMEYFFKELDLHEIMVERTESDPVEYKGKLYSDFWNGESDSSLQHSYQRVQEFLKNVSAEKDRAFPLIPSLNSKHQESVKYFDQYTLYELLNKITHNQLPKQLATAIEYYCWSTYAASAKEISAASALNFLAQEGNSIYVGAGGNAKIVERILTRLLKYIPSKNLRTQSIVVQVKVSDNHVDVLYEDKDRILRQIRTKCCVLACPKYVVKKILYGVEDTRISAINQIEYRSYLTANLLVKKRMERSFYDLFMINNAQIDLTHTKSAHEKMNATDFVMGNFAAGQKDFNVLTFYNAFPYSNARPELMGENAYETQKNRFQNQIQNSILPLLHLKQNDIVDLRLARFGHALPLAKKGFFQKNYVQDLRQPFKNRVFFVEQDNWAYPSLQTGATDAWLLQDNINKILVDIT